MMLHTGYLRGNLDAIGYEAKGMPVGIGGVSLGTRRRHPLR